MARKGRRAAVQVKEQVKLVQPASWAKGDRTIVRSPKSDGFKATVLKVGEKRAKVKFDTGQVEVVKRSMMFTIPRCQNLWCRNEASVASVFCEDCLKQERSTARQRASVRDAQSIDKLGADVIRWTPDAINFTFDVAQGEDKIHIYGWYRRTKIIKTDEIAHAIDIFVVKNEKEYSLDTIAYSYDPRKNMGTLNADICARVQRWFSTQLNGSAITIDDLRRQAEHPVVKITRIETIDHLLMKLREFRDTAIRAGGQRLFPFKGNSGPEIHIVIDVSTQALLLKGKVPTLEMGGVYDIAKGGEQKRPILKMRGSPENINALLKQLAEVKGNKREERRIRGLLRSMGHKGGTRAVKPELQQHEKEDTKKERISKKKKKKKHKE